MNIPQELRKKLPPGLDDDLQEEFAEAIKVYATDSRWREILEKVSKFAPPERDALLKSMENEESLDDLSRNFVMKLVNGDMADKLLECVQIYDQNPW